MTTYKDSANIVDGTLVLSFPNAIKPVMWNMDLAEAKTSALEIEDADSETYALTFTKEGAKKNTVVAAFETREKALGALMMVSNALAGDTKAAPYKHISCGHTGDGKRGKKCSVIKCFLWMLAGLLILFILFMISASLRMTRVTGVNGNTMQSSQSAAPIESGVPMSADDFLNGR